MKKFGLSRLQKSRGNMISIMAISFLPAAKTQFLYLHLDTGQKLKWEDLLKGHLCQNPKYQKPMEAPPAVKQPEEPKLPKVEEANTEISDTSFPEDDKVPLEVYIKSPSATGINNRDILYAEVWENPPSIVAKKYGTTDWSIWSMCKRMDVPLPDRGYWAKVRAGKPIEKAPLPKIKKVADENKPKTGSSRKLQIPENSLGLV